MADNKEREQLIGSILNELNELEMLTKGMQDPRMLEELAIKKAKKLLCHYQELHEGAPCQTSAPTATTAEEPAVATATQKEEPKTEVVVEVTPQQEEVVVSTKAEEPAKTPAKPANTVEEKAPAKSQPATTAPAEAAKAAEKTEPTVLAPKVAKPAEPEKKKQAAPAKSGKGVSFIDSLKVKSLKSALTMGDKFRYNSELFKNMGLLNSTIAELDQMQNLGEALAYINAHFNWDSENEAYIDFMQLLEKRFEHRI